jgi:RNA polymerase sigma factor (sigma-70 family)
VDDLEQVAGAELWKQTGLYNASRGVPFQGFALAAVRGACLMSVRRRQYADSTMEDVNELPPDKQPIERGRNPECRAVEREQVSLALRMMSKLPNAQRRVLELHLLDDLPLVECARRMRRSQAEIYPLKERAMAALRDLIQMNAERGKPPEVPAWGHRRPNADQQAGDWGS